MSLLQNSQELWTAAFTLLSSLARTLGDVDRARNIVCSFAVKGDFAFEENVLKA